MSLKDKRMKLLNEVFNGIKVRIVICSDYSVISHFSTELLLTNYSIICDRSTLLATHSAATNAVPMTIVS